MLWLCNGAAREEWGANETVAATRMLIRWLVLAVEFVNEDAGGGPESAML